MQPIRVSFCWVSSQMMAVFLDDPRSIEQFDAGSKSHTHNLCPYNFAQDRHIFGLPQRSRERLP